MHRFCRTVNFIFERYSVRSRTVCASCTLSIFISFCRTVQLEQKLKFTTKAQLFLEILRRSVPIVLCLSVGTIFTLSPPRSPPTDLPSLTDTACGNSLLQGRQFATKGAAVSTSHTEPCVHKQTHLLSVSDCQQKERTRTVCGKARHCCDTAPTAAAIVTASCFQVSDVSSL
jgi:hypothetical protein